jgi:hypothetical protein
MNRRGTCARPLLDAIYDSSFGLGIHKLFKLKMGFSLVLNAIGCEPNRQNAHRAREIYVNESRLLRLSTYSTARNTKILFHGYTNDVVSEFVIQTRNGKCTSNCFSCRLFYLINSSHFFFLLIRHDYFLTNFILMYEFS